MVRTRPNVRTATETTKRDRTCLVMKAEIELRKQFKPEKGALYIVLANPQEAEPEAGQQNQRTSQYSPGYHNYQYLNRHQGQQADRELAGHNRYRKSPPNWI